jgi:hypothetical protein
MLAICLEMFRWNAGCNNGAALHNLARRLCTKPIFAMVNIAVQCSFVRRTTNTQLHRVFDGALNKRRVLSASFKKSFV